MAAPHCIVIGSGIIGASIAWHLAEAGARVSVLEAGSAGGLATRDSWAWINASWGNPEPYFRLRLRAMAEWQRLDAAVPGLGWQRCGGLLWDLAPEALQAYAAQHRAWGYKLEWWEAPQIGQRVPALRQPPPRALWAPDEAQAEPLQASLALLAAAQARGATLHTGTPVRALVAQAGRVVGVRTDAGVVWADEVIIAAGTGSAALLDALGLPLPIEAPVGLLVHSTPTRPLLPCLLMTPALHVRQTRDGRLLAGADYVGRVDEGDPEVQAQALWASVKDTLHGTAGLALERFSLGRRPTPADGLPLLGRPRNLAGLYLAVTHSGVTLAPAVGVFAAQELLQGQRDALLSPFHPDRLLPDA